MTAPWHPYRLTPVLPKSWLYDGYERFLVTQIRRGRRRSELFDFNSLVLDYGARAQAEREWEAEGQRQRDTARQETRGP